MEAEGLRADDALPLAIARAVRAAPARRQQTMLRRYLDQQDHH